MLPCLPFLSAPARSWALRLLTVAVIGLPAGVPALRAATAVAPEPDPLPSDPWFDPYTDRWVDPEVDVTEVPLPDPEELALEWLNAEEVRPRLRDLAAAKRVLHQLAASSGGPADAGTQRLFQCALLARRAARAAVHKAAWEQRFHRKRQYLVQGYDPKQVEQVLLEAKALVETFM